MIYSSKNPSKKLTLHFLFQRFYWADFWMYPDDLSRTPAENELKGKGCITNHLAKAESMLITIQSACERLAVSRSTLYRLISEGRLKRVYIKGAPRISLASLEALVGGH